MLRDAVDTQEKSVCIEGDAAYWPGAGRPGFNPGSTVTL